MRTKWFTIAALVFVATLTLFALPSASPAAAQACSAIHTTDMATWNTSDTRATGHYELMDSALHIWTESNTSTDKVAAYYPLSAPLSTVTSASMSYTTLQGTIPPGMQIVISVGGDMGILVGEPAFPPTFIQGCIQLQRTLAVFGGPKGYFAGHSGAPRSPCRARDRRFPPSQ